MNVGFLIKELRTDRFSIYCRVSFGAKDKGVPFATGVILDKKEHWENKRGYNFTILSKERNARIKTDTLLLLKSELEEIYLNLKKLKRATNSKIITDIYRGNEEPELTTIQIVDEFVERQLLRDIEPATKTGYKRYRTDFNTFCRENDISHLPTSEFTITHGKNYFDFLRTKLNKPNSEAVAKKKVAMVEKSLKEAARDKRIESNPLEGLEIKIIRKKTPHVFLSQAELARIERKTFKIERLEKIRIAFIFSCYTGFHFNQMKIFDAEKHIFEENGIQFISTNRDKNNNYIGVPIFKRTRKLLESCNYKLSIPSNAHYNGYLREIADICKITKYLTSKIGRKTFIDMQMNRYGVPKPIVSRMVAHSSVRTTEKYYGDLDRTSIFRETQSQL
ncbi:phage integrase SAM-like domain-containing protein [Bernardetia sp.]|uniref:phage integrase SAM-like domain-containing protein n=1 Tax=Bernardetia sp. TaxID=1937974 RepID=UPI0025C6F16A|nr:phage integrase SAM-like domain-containing protein [Bernardetia sp.]